MSCVFKHQDLKKIVSIITNVSHFHPPEVVDRGSEKQLQVSENLFYVKWVKN